MNFADRLSSSISKNNSLIVAGFDPVLDSLPGFILEQAQKQSTQEDAIYSALVDFHILALEVLQGRVCAIKPNIAFFEQYGIGGLRAFYTICANIKGVGLPIIADAKRGDIGSTAKAYSSAFLGRSKIFSKVTPILDVDALTISPYLGFDTIETYFDDCKEFGKGLFVLVKTSNPGSAGLQGLQTTNKHSMAENVALWLAEKAQLFVGQSGLSSLGAVVGATYPDEAIRLRALMPKNYFLIPGMGAQGGSANDAIAGLNSQKTGGVINISRGLLGDLKNIDNKEVFLNEVEARLKKFNHEIQQALI